MGGAIAQYLAMNYPSTVRKLILVTIGAKPDKKANDILTSWVKMAKNKRYGDIVIDMIEKSYSKDKIRKFRFFYWALKRIGKSKSFNRFIVQAEAFKAHNTLDELHRIKCPTLIIGGKKIGLSVLTW